MADPDGPTFPLGPRSRGPHTYQEATVNVAQRGLTVLVGGTAIAMAVSTQALAQPAPATSGIDGRQQLQPERQSRPLRVLRVAPQRPRLHAEGVTSRPHPQATPSGYGPSSLQSRLQAAVGHGRQPASASTSSTPTTTRTPTSDLATYRTQYGLPACTTANGCFQKLNQNGATSPLPTGDTGWAGEISLDLDMVSAVCPNCTHHADRGERRLGQPVHRGQGGHHPRREVRLDELGRPRGRHRVQPTTRTYFQPSGVVYTASTGDGAYSAGVIYPATSPRVVAVGGTVAEHRVEQPRLDRDGVEDQQHRGHRLGLLERRGQALVAERHLQLDLQPGAPTPTSRPSPTRPPVSRSTRPTAAAAGPSTAAPARRRRSSRRSTPWPARPASTDKPGSLPYAHTGEPERRDERQQRHVLAAAAVHRGGRLGRPDRSRHPERRRGVRRHGGGGGNTVTVTNPGAKTGTVGTATSLQISASDSGGAALTYTATGLPTGLSINASSGLISGTPSAAGTFSVTVDGEGQHRRLGQHDVHLDDLDVRRRRFVLRPEAAQPGLRVRCDQLDARPAA